MILVLVSIGSLGLALIPVLMAWRNAPLFQPPPPLSESARSTASVLPAISVLIPARNEESSIAAAVESVLASQGVELELIVLDDHSEDRTAAIVREFAIRDSRVRLETAPPLPPDWCGKQHACYSLARLARHDILTFLDADVRLHPEALARMIAFQQQSGAELVSGFPRQETGTVLEKLVIPLINWLLISYLPMAAMRSTRKPEFGAGCGQWFLTIRSAYEQVGGHAAVRHSLHDGVTLPRAYRRAGFRTDIADATDLAVCRMYRSAGQVWNGLAKNAREGLGAWPLILIWTVLLAGGQILPLVLLLLGLDLMFKGLIASRLLSDWLAPESSLGETVTVLALLACLAVWLLRFWTTWRFRASWLGAVLHPVGVAVLLAIQWYATLRVWLGRPVGWKGRAHPSLSIK